MAGCCGPAHRTFLFHKMQGIWLTEEPSAPQEGLRYMDLFICLSLDDGLLRLYTV
jgi:hypothetical protein